MAAGGEDTGDAPLLKATDAWWTVLVVDPVVVRVVPVMVPWTRITPSAVTIAAHLLGLVSALGFLRGDFVWAAVLFEVRFVLDCIDGKLARARGTSSEVGALLDYAGDFLVVSVNLACLGIGLVWADELPVWVAVALPAAFLSYVANSQAWYAELGGRGTSSGLTTSERIPGGYRAWMTRHRLRPAPTRIDFEHGLLFCAALLAGLLDDATPLVLAIGLTLAFLVYGTLHFLEMRLRWAARHDADRRASSGGDQPGPR